MPKTFVSQAALLPSGKREAFQFAPIGDAINQVTRIESMKYYGPAFKSLNGSTSSLQVKLRSDDAIPSADQRTVLLSKGTDDKFRQGSNPFDPADPLFGLEYVLTTKEGTAYIIDPATGKLQEVRDRKGNRITYTDDAIVSSTGKQIQFDRDAQGRIVAVRGGIDPDRDEEELIRYSYNAQGDLVQVTDPKNQATKFVYSAENAHYLQEIVDPLGRTGAKTEYDANGRLKQIINSMGTPTTIAYNPDESVQITKDGYGNWSCSRLVEMVENG